MRVDCEAAIDPAHGEFLKELGVDAENPPDEENLILNKVKWRMPAGLELLSTKWPLETLPIIARKEVLGHDLEGSMTGLALASD